MCHIISWRGVTVVLLYCTYSTLDECYVMLGLIATIKIKALLCFQMTTQTKRATFTSSSYFV
jgi:hypothetical protein